MPWFKLFDLSIVFMYFAGSVLYLSGFMAGRKKVKKTAVTLAVIGFVLHSFDLAVKLYLPSAQALTQNQFYFSLLAWVFILVYFALWWRIRLEFLALTAAPLALVLFTSSLSVSQVKLNVPDTLSWLWFCLHIGSLFLSMGLLAMACGAGIAYLFLERKIKTKSPLGAFSREMPSLNAFDLVNRLAVLWGFPLFTLGLLAGYTWAAIAWDRVFSWDPKEVVTIGVWFVFGYLFHQRIALGWQGKKPAKLAIFLFAVSVVSLLGINYLLPSHHTFRP
ncbi:MAG: cytochrome c biogenesis protein CcsA [Desulfonatronovibrionaceae bacterium]